MDIHELTENGVELVRLENRATGEHMDIAPRYGANCCRVCVRLRDRLVSIINGYRSSGEFRESAFFKSSLLTPFPNRVRNGLYRFNGVERQLTVNFAGEHNACHGFVYNREFEAVNAFADGRRASVTFHYAHDGTWPGYPFIFELTVSYILDAQWGVIAEVEAKNTGDDVMPFGVGWHPYFTLGRPADQLELHMPAEWVIRTDGGLIPNGELEPFSGFPSLTPIGSLALDHGFVVNGAPGGGMAVSRLVSPLDGVEIGVWQETGEGKCNHVQVYIPPDRGSVAIEPMTCRADAFNNGEGLWVLEPGRSRSARFGFKWGERGMSSADVMGAANDTGERG